MGAVADLPAYVVESKEYVLLQMRVVVREAHTHFRN
jgi:hypothetical protein